MKILVVAATPNELKSVKSGIKSANVKANFKIDYLCSGIGNYETIHTLENYLAKNGEPVFVRNIGICGYWNPDNLKKADPIQIANVINIHNEKEMIVPIFTQIAPLRNCFSSETIIFKKPELKKEIGATNDERYFDMESWGIEFVSARHKIPRLILKVPFDLVGEETENFFDYNGKSLKEKLAYTCESLEKLPYNNYLQKILERIACNEL